MIEPEVPATTNADERSLRNLVVSRKISGGTRSPRGTATKVTLAFLFGTWPSESSTKERITGPLADRYQFKLSTL